MNCRPIQTKLDKILDKYRPERILEDHRAQMDIVRSRLEFIENQERRKVRKFHTGKVGISDEVSRDKPTIKSARVHPREMTISNLDTHVIICSQKDAGKEPPVVNPLLTAGYIQSDIDFPPLPSAPSKATTACVLDSGKTHSKYLSDDCKISVDDLVHPVGEADTNTISNAFEEKNASRPATSSSKTSSSMNAEGDKKSLHFAKAIANISEPRPTVKHSLCPAAKPFQPMHFDGSLSSECVEDDSDSDDSFTSIYCDEPPPSSAYNHWLEKQEIRAKHKKLKKEYKNLQAWLSRCSCTLDATDNCLLGN
jgi:hypothetical protein